MLIVADANELFSALIARNKTLEMFLHNSLEIISPSFIIQEFREHLDEISIRAKITPHEAMTFAVILMQKVRLIDVKDYEDFLKEAQSLISDLDDIDYIALALKFNCSLWSEDKGIRDNSKVKVMNTKELLQSLS